MSQEDVTRPESVDENERTRAAEADKKPKSRRPANTAFRQQRLKAWQPILTPKSVLPLFFIVGVLFAPIGGVLIWASSQVQELVLDYTDCGAQAPSTWQSIPHQVSYTFKAKPNTTPSWKKSVSKENGTTTCSLMFEIPESMGPPVFMYYRLTNFYQNHRRYVQSLSLDQLKGTAVSNSTIKSSTCSPLAIDDKTQKAIYPCGLIANSMFNDSISEPKLLSGDQSSTGTYNMTKKGIAWSSDKELYKQTKYSQYDVVAPPNWADKNYEKDGIPNLHEDEDFMVWMRTAGLPSFSKMSRRNDDTAMEKGTYQLDITDRMFEMEWLGNSMSPSTPARKAILLSTRTVMGGKNPFMGIAYVVVGGVCVLLGALFTIAYLVRPRKLGDHTYLTWDTTNQPSTATTTGRDDRGAP
ncbi:hypothetical protein N7509_001092 [Penicillium cosmopolitanum]|uniref:Cell cycle control protein n=1 Tax=Penicillium cosmopolitanum TaxID=1131564 RepID=A0A9W9WBP7_9EURO|nr:uncharacterized protein N7509_001092 [Penicillium cosmopolitanum]KAJ5414465.1 hypothetical protein N7509_001092 [Penicillium cosmopolitanum]